MWGPTPGQPHVSSLWLNGVQVGGYDHDARIYRELRNGAWSAPLPPPWEVVGDTDGCVCNQGCLCVETKRCTCKGDCSCSPCPGLPPKKTQVMEAWMTDGVDHSKIQGGETCCVNGRQCSKGEAFAAIQIPADQNLLRVTVVSTEKGVREQLLNDMKAAVELAPWKDRLVVQTYTPDRWEVKDFAPRPPVSILIQSPSGEVLARQDDYTDGPKGLAVNLEDAQRKYDSSRNQDTRSGWWLHSLFDPSFNLNVNSGDFLTIAIAGAVLYLLLKKK